MVNRAPPAGAWPAPGDVLVLVFAVGGWSGTARLGPRLLRCCAPLRAYGKFTQLTSSASATLLPSQHSRKVAAWSATT